MCSWKFALQTHNLLLLNYNSQNDSDFLENIALYFFLAKNTFALDLFFEA